MAQWSRSSYKNQLPKFTPWTLERVVNLGGAFAALLGLIFVFTSYDQLTSDTKSIVVLTYLVIIIFVLIVWIYNITRKRLANYAQALFYIHFVNHVVRDHLAELDDRKVSSTFADVLRDCVDSIATCYSLVTGSRCRVSIKEIKNLSDGQIVTAMRDTISDKSARGDEGEHFISENTDFEQIWTGSHGCSRYFRSNNLKRDWKNHNYKNSSFKIPGEPEAFTIGIIPLTHVIRADQGIVWVCNLLTIAC